jgi:hypothetical protein
MENELRRSGGGGGYLTAQFIIAVPKFIVKKEHVEWIDSLQHIHAIFLHILSVKRIIGIVLLYINLLSKYKKTCLVQNIFLSSKRTENTFCRRHNRVFEM